jgi:hypothetical protein
LYPESLGAGGMNYNIDKNRPVFMKPDKTSPDRFTKNRPVTIQNLNFVKKEQKLEKSSDKPENGQFIIFRSKFEF